MRIPEREEIPIVDDPYPTSERNRLIRMVRQRLESLQRAGLTTVPVPVPPVVVRRPPPPPRRTATAVDPPRPIVAPSPSPPPERAASLFEESEIETPSVPPGERKAM